MSENNAREKIEILVSKYKSEADSGGLRKYTEEDVKKGFILPLFEALEWDAQNRDEVSSEEHIKSSGRVDYGFYINNQPKFYLEAKKPTANIHDELSARQAVRYSWNRGVTWAVLTNFERLIVFNAQDIKSSLKEKLLFDISYSDYISSLDRLWLLSKESFSANAIDGFAEKIGKKYQKIPISDTLYKDLDKCREILTKELASWNKEKLKNKPDLLDEGVQKLLDRLIFIRVAEDRGVEPPTLLPLVRQWESSKQRNETPLYESMVGKFRELDEIYNSNLFQEHLFEEWEEYGGKTEEAIKVLYGKEGYYEYDFKVMPADVLGTVYENYLGHRLSQSKKGITLAKDASKRKEQGIYYTPAFIVDYIVRRALQPVLDKCKTINELLKIKVLDPACGSGSFLIKALEVLNEKYKSLGQKGDEMTKITIIMNNLYGVDLDGQAVEIARLNLLINALDKKGKLPQLTNIKCGNSLISGTDAELKKYFGANFRGKKPFNWEEEFPRVFERGGFDVVIGNPPYVDSEEMAKSQPDLRDYSVKKYTVAKGNWDIFCIFIERGMDVLKRGGSLGMIVPNKLISAKYALATRNLLSSNSVLALADYSSIAVFGASVYPIVVIAKKGEDKNHKIEITVNHGVNFPMSSSTRIFPGDILTEHKDSWAPLFEEKGGLDFLDKTIHRFPRLEKIKSFNVVGAATVSEAYEIKKMIREMAPGQNDDFRFINTGTIDRYCSLWGIKSTRYIKGSYNKPSLPNNEFKKVYPKRYEQANSPKIIIGGMSKFLECFLDEGGQYVPGKSTTIILGENLNSLKILLGILNSRLISVIYSRVFRSLSLAGGFFRIGTPQVKLLPISLPRRQDARGLVGMIDKMLDLNKKPSAVEENSNEWRRLKSEIEKTDKKIDEEVYKLYGLTEEEIAVVEGGK